MVTLNAHFDGKAIVFDEPSTAPLPSGTRLRISVEPIDTPESVTPAPRKFEPLNIRIASDLSNAIALDPSLRIEEM